MLTVDTNKLSQKVSDLENKERSLDGLEKAIADLTVEIDTKKEIRDNLTSDKIIIEGEVRDLQLILDDLRDSKLTKETEIGKEAQAIAQAQEKLTADQIALAKDRREFEEYKTQEEKRVAELAAEAATAMKKAETHEEAVDTYAAKLEEYKNRLLRIAHGRGITESAPELADTSEE